MAVTSPIWPDLKETHPLCVLHNELAAILSEEPAHKIWGITLSPDPSHFFTKLVLQKFLRANKGDKGKAKKQLEDTLQWRRGYFDENGKVIGNWDQSKFEDLAYITKETVKDAGAEMDKEVVVTWNIYGHVKDFAKTFGDVEEFLRWRVDLMERSVKLLDLTLAKEPIPDWNSEQSTVDPYQAMQVHDYLQVSFFRTPAEVKNASKKTIELFQKYYPELLEKKFFVNVPFLMGWVYNAMKLLVAKETFKKLIMLSYGEELAKHMGSGSIPAVYGGKGKPLENTGENDKEEILEAVSAEPVHGAEVAPEEQPSVSTVPEVTSDGAAIVDDAVPTPDDQVVPVPVSVTPDDQVVPVPASVTPDDQVVPVPAGVTPDDQVVLVPASVTPDDQVVPAPASATPANAAPVAVMVIPDFPVSGAK